MSYLKSLFENTSIGRATSRLLGLAPSDEPPQHGIDMSLCYEADGTFNPTKALQLLDLSQKRLDKFQVITSRFIDTVHGFLAGNHITTNIDNARAVCTLVSDFAKHYQKAGLLPANFELDYSAKVVDIKRGDPYKEARYASNFAKHADKDADHVFSYLNEYTTHGLMVAMVRDYKTLYYAMLDAGLLARDSEELYKVKSDSLVLKDRDTYGPYAVVMRDLVPVGVTESGQNIYSLTGMQREEMQSKHAFVPAAIAASVLFEEWNHHLFSMKNGRWRELDDALKDGRAFAKQMEKIGVWPNDDRKNAMITRDPAIVETLPIPL